MDMLIRFYRSSLGKKYIMALTGIALFGFIIGHMLGNLQIFLGPKALNDYAQFLKARPGLLWSARVGLVILAVLHIITAAQLALANRRARPVAYAEKDPSGASFASRTIVMSGLIILAFLVYHLLHFTVGVTNPEYMLLRDPVDPLRHDVYRMSVVGFSNIWVSTFYVISMGLLCLHLSHGVSSMFQSLGVSNKRYAAGIDWFAKISALVIFIGNCSIPIAVLTGIVK